MRQNHLHLQTLSQERKRERNPNHVPNEKQKFTENE